MKTLIITAIVFLALCTTMFFNYRYINDTADKLTELTESLEFSDTEKCGETISEIERIWENSSETFSLTVSFREIDYLGETLLALSSAHENRDEVEFERYRSLLIDAIDGVSRLEKFSVMNIL